MDARSQALLEFPLIRERLAAATSFGPSRALAAALEPSSEPVVVARWLDETDQARALLTERPGVGIGAAHDIAPAVGSGGTRRPARCRAVPGDRRDARCDGPPGHIADRRATPAAARSRARAAAVARPAQHAGAQLRSGRRAARHGIAPARRAARGGPGRLRPAAPAVGRAGRRGARRGPPGADRHAAQRPLRGAGQGRGAIPGQGHRPRRLGQRPDPVHRAARRRRARQCLARGPGGGGRGDRAHPRRAVRPRGGERGRALGHARRAGAVRPVGRQGRARRRDGRGPGDHRRPPRGRAPVGPPPGAERSGRADRRASRRRRAGPRRDRPQHRWQDRHAAHARPAQPHAPVRPAHPGSRGQQAPGLARRVRRHRRRAVDRAVALDVLRSPPAHHGDRRGGGPGHARPARRARGGHGSHRGLGARAGAPRPLHPGRGHRGGDDPLRRAQGLRPHDTGCAQRGGRVRPGHAVADLPTDDRSPRRQSGLRHRRATRPAPGHRRRCPIAADRGAAVVRGDARLDQGDRGRDERTARPGTSRGAARGRGPGDRPGRAPPGTSRAGRRRPRGACRGRPGRGRPARRAGRHAADAGTRDGHGGRHRRGARPRGVGRGAAAGARARGRTVGPGRCDPTDLATGRPSAEPVGRVGGSDRGARPGRSAGDPRSGRPADRGRAGRSRAGRRSAAEPGHDRRVVERCGRAGQSVTARSRRPSTCAVPGSRKRWRPSSAISTMRPWPG